MSFPAYPRRRPPGHNPPSFSPQILRNPDLAASGRPNSGNILPGNQEYEPPWICSPLSNIDHQSPGIVYSPQLTPNGVQPPFAEPTGQGPVQARPQYDLAHNMSIDDQFFNNDSNQLESNFDQGPSVNAPLRTPPRNDPNSLIMACIYGGNIDVILHLRDKTSRVTNASVHWNNDSYVTREGAEQLGLTIRPIPSRRLTTYLEPNTGMISPKEYAVLNLEIPAVGIDRNKFEIMVLDVASNSAFIHLGVKALKKLFVSQPVKILGALCIQYGATTLGEMLITCESKDLQKAMKSPSGENHRQETTKRTSRKDKGKDPIRVARSGRVDQRRRGNSTVTSPHPHRANSTIAMTLQLPATTGREQLPNGAQISPSPMSTAWTPLSILDTTSEPADLSSFGMQTSTEPVALAPQPMPFSPIFQAGIGLPISAEQITMTRASLTGTGDHGDLPDSEVSGTGVVDPRWLTSDDDGIHESMGSFGPGP
ncbi:hypothetical protein AAE478_007428 [Parahypoxylon ruwenzoriense]